MGVCIFMFSEYYTRRLTPTKECINAALCRCEAMYMLEYSLAREDLSISKRETLQNLQERRDKGRCHIDVEEDKWQDIRNWYVGDFYLFFAPA